MIKVIVVACLIGLFAHRHRKRLRTSLDNTLTKEVPELIDQLNVLLRAGYTPANALRQLEPWLTAPMRRVIANINVLIRRGVRFTSAIVELRHEIGPPVYAIVDALIQLDRDGLSATTVLDRLSVEAHAQRRRRAEAEARELPIRLIFPMVCCVLPSFIILTVVPLLAGTLLGMRTHLG